MDTMKEKMFLIELNFNFLLSVIQLSLFPLFHSLNAAAVFLSDKTNFQKLLNSQPDAKMDVPGTANAPLKTVNIIAIALRAGLDQTVRYHLR
jgi:hypothetical protein